MDIQAISPISLPKANAVQKTVETQTVSQNKPDKKHKKLPYVAAGVVLAGLGAYVFRNKLFKLKNTIQEIKPPLVTPIEEKVVAETILEAEKVPKMICVGFENNKPIYQKFEKIEGLLPAKSAVAEARNAINFGDERIFAVINKNRNEQAKDFIRIIEENTIDGHVDLVVMRKIALDFADDAKGRGENRFHQAADLLEQAYVKEFVKGNENKKGGLQNLYDYMRNTDGTLFEMYTKMPIEESANRLHHLKTNVLNIAEYSGMDANRFFDTSFSRLVEKFQFKKYNEAHNILG